MLATSLLTDHKSKPKRSTEILVRILLCCQTLKSLEMLLCEKNKPPFFLKLLFVRHSLVTCSQLYFQQIVVDCTTVPQPLASFLIASLYTLVHSCINCNPQLKVVYPSPSWQTGTCDLLNKPMEHQQIFLTFTRQVWVNSFKRECVEFSGGPVTKTLCSHNGVGGKGLIRELYPTCHN